jgi:hypothetical protein
MAALTVRSAAQVGMVKRRSQPGRGPLARVGFSGFDVTFSSALHCNILVLRLRHGLRPKRDISAESLHSQQDEKAAH